MPQMQPSAEGAPVTLTRAIVAEQLRARLNGQLDDGKLAGWAFDHFYQVELGEEILEAGYEPVIAHILDTLMFSDDTDFRLNQEELRTLITQLGNV